MYTYFIFYINIYINPINFFAPLIFEQHECLKINSMQNRPFFAHLSAQKLMVCNFFEYHFRPEFDGILQYFSPPQIYPVNKPEKENPTKNCKVVLVSQVKSYKHKFCW